MIKYILKRVLISIPIFIGITFIVFFLSYQAPGGPVDLIAYNSTGMTEEQIQDLREEYNLDKPLVVQYGIWVFDLLQGDFGTSYRTSGSVGKIIGERIGPTIVLAVSTFIISLIFSVLIGVFAAYKPGGIFDGFARAFSFIASSTPSFFLSLILIYFFSIKMKLLPNQGYGTTLEDRAIHMIMPVIVLSVHMVGIMIRYVRNSMMDVLNAEYMTAARSKGITEKAVIIRHGLRNAMMPIVTVLGNAIPVLIGGSVVIEQIYSWPGIGSLMVLSIQTRDYPAIMGITVVIALVVLVTNLVVDLIYGAIDPRISR